MKLALHGGWTVRPTDGPVPDDVGHGAVEATVPGCVTTDLIGAGLVPDPYLDANEALLAWVGRTGWRYETSFEVPPAGDGERTDLVCEGLDTIATVRLNGLEVGRASDMHLCYRWDVSSLLAPGTNHLEIEFEAAVDAAERWEAELGPRPNVSAHPYNALRKMACNYGWDWGPDLPTCGIWRPVALERWHVARIAAVRPLSWVLLPGAGEGAPTTLEEEAPPAGPGSPVTAQAVLEAHVDIERGAGAAQELSVEVSVAGRCATAEVPAGASSVVVRLELPEVDLWWPHGYGAQPLYDLNVCLRARGDEVFATWPRRTGFPAGRVGRGPDERGSRLGFVVNGRAVNVRGANWVPDDCFPQRVSRERYRERLSQAVGANMNLLRVWGGGIFESEDFYGLADELGLMVWQDFLLACAAYAEEPPLRPLFEAEARQAVTRLCAHPSLAAWSGGNENIWGHEDWGWKDKLGGLTWGEAYYFDVFPSVVGELDPTRAYMAGSPWSFGHDAHPNDARFGSKHVWDVWNEKDYLAYREHQPQFVSEFGFQGPPTWSTLTRSLTARPLDLGMPELAVHQKAAQGNDKLARWAALRFPQPEAFEDWHWATSLVQARAVALGVEYWRALVPRCRGTVVWQLNDCWPVVSWSAVDGDGRLKPLWYALRHAYADRLLTIQPPEAGEGGAEGAMVLALVNDSKSTWRADIDVARTSFSGEVLASTTVAAEVAPGASERRLLPAGLTAAGRPAGEVLVATGADRRAVWFYAEDKDLELPPPSLSARWRRTPEGYAIEVEADGLQRDVALLADKVAPEAHVDDMLVTLPAGQRHTFEVRSPELADPDALLAPTVLRSANQLVHGAARS